tara:strand:+ start:424 stop:549 length:126 start_codon:yes stop_codon:yes gene_type:complete
MDWKSFWIWFLFGGLGVFLFVSFTTAKSGFSELRDFFNKKD